MEEEWRNIEGFPNYEVSNMGRVRSLDHYITDTWGRHYFRAGKMIKLRIQTGKKDHYSQIMACIYDGRKMHRVIVARIVAKAFIPNPNNYPQVNHKDENSLNNCVDNLEWCTCSYNINYGNYIKRRSASKKRSVDVFDMDMNYIKTCDGLVDAGNEFNVLPSSISMCCHNKCKSTRGYRFKFHNEDNSSQPYTKPHEDSECSVEGSTTR